MATRFGQRLRARILRDAAAVIVGTEAVARTARRLLHIRADRIRVIPLAPRPAFRLAEDAASLAALRRRGNDERHRLGLPDRFLLYSGRHDARQDLATLLEALAELGRTGNPATPDDQVPWPPRVVVVDATPDDRAAIARSAARLGVGECFAFAPRLEPERLAALVATARAVVVPVVSEAAGLAAIEAIAVGTPVIASSVGALPEIVGAAGILVDPRDPDRLVAALLAAWTDDGRDRLARIAAERAAEPRTWADVARETRDVYAAVAG